MLPTPGVKPCSSLHKHIHPARLFEVKQEIPTVILDGHLHDDPMELPGERDKPRISESKL
jgi:hypothetical protein